MTLTELSIKRPTIIVVLFSFLGVLGIFGFSQLKYDLMPKMTAPVIVITTIYPGASPNEVENSVTKIVEDAVTGLDKVNTLRSSSSEGRSFIYIEFEASANINQSIEDATRKVNEVAAQLPITAKKPIISKLSFDEIPVLRMAVQSKMSEKEFYQFVKDNIQPRFSRIDGVGMIALSGGEEREIKVNIDRNKLKSFGISLAQVTASIKTQNIDFPTGNIKESNDQYVVRVAGKFSSVEELSDLIVGRSKQGGDIKLSDIADVYDGIKEAYNFNRLNGISSIGITIQKQSDANTVEVSRRARAEIAKIEKDFKNIGIQFTIAQDNSTFIMDSANAVKEDLLLAILLVAFVMLMFLHSLRNSFIVMVAIPASLVSTFFAMYIFDFTLNMMTLLAMSLVIGILVDDSIVVLENIYRHLEMKEKPGEAALKGRNEIGFAALSITLVDVVVFVPLALISGIIGNFLREYALVVVFSTLMSLLVSFTITPALASRFSKLQDLTRNTLMGKISSLLESGFNWLTDLYKRILNWSLNKLWHRFSIITLSIVLFLSSFVIAGMGFIGFEFIPQVDRGEMIITIELEPGATIERTNEVTHYVESILNKKPEVEKVLCSVGASSEGFLNVFQPNFSSVTVTLCDKSKRAKSTDQLSQEIKKELYEIPGCKIKVSPVSLMGTSNRSPIQILVTGTNYKEVSKAAVQIADVVQTVDGTSDVRLSSEDGKPELRVNIDRKKMAQFGLSINDVGQNLKIAFTGDDDAKYREGTTEYGINIILDRFDRSKVDDVEHFTFVNNKGQLVELNQFANVYQTTGPTKLERENRMSSISVTSQVFGKASGTVANEIGAKLQSLKLADDIRYEFTGEQKTMGDSFLSMGIALLAGILFVYMIMVALYNSFLYPFVVLFSIPLAMIGALYGLAFTAKSISIYSILGIIMLVGLVAKNAILLVDRTNQMRSERNMSTFDALLEAGQTRLRPIIMTTIAMVMGMLPIALSASAGSEAKSGLAVVLIGGLLSSMFLTLVLVPVVYLMFDSSKEKLRKLFKLKPKESIL